MDYNYTRTADEIIRETVGPVAKETPEKPKIEKAFPCPRNACMGLVMHKTGRCITCQHTCCVTCREVVEEGEPHKCDKDVVMTIERIKKTSKQCPTCKVQVEKTKNTCNQMYCTMCSTLFDYSTGECSVTFPIDRTYNRSHYLCRKTSHEREVDSQSTCDRSRDARRAGH